MIGAVVRIALVVAGTWWLLFGGGFTVLRGLLIEKQPAITSCVKGDGAPEIACPKWRVPGGGQ